MPSTRNQGGPRYPDLARTNVMTADNLYGNIIKMEDDPEDSSVLVLTTERDETYRVRKDRIVRTVDLGVPK